MSLILYLIPAQAEEADISSLSDDRASEVDKRGGGDVLDHRRTLQTQSPTENPHPLGNAHRLEHLRSEHPAVSNLDRLVELLVVLEDLE